MATAADVGDGIGPKPRVEQCVVIDAARWQREGILEGFTRSRGGVSFIGYQLETMDMRSPFIHLNYTLSDGRHASGVLQKFNYKVDLRTTRPHFGGLRWWFTCPLCRRRAQKLYHPRGGDRFGCRYCYNLSYASRSYTASDRAQKRARAIRQRLGGSASLLEAFPLKPRGMWWKTYDRLLDQCQRYDTTAWILFDKWLENLERRVH